MRLDEYLSGDDNDVIGGCKYDMINKRRVLKAIYHENISYQCINVAETSNHTNFDGKLTSTITNYSKNEENANGAIANKDNIYYTINENTFTASDSFTDYNNEYSASPLSSDTNTSKTSSISHLYMFLKGLRGHCWERLVVDKIHLKEPINRI